MQAKNLVIKAAYIKEVAVIMNSEDYWWENVRQLNDEISSQPLAVDVAKIQRKSDVILEIRQSAAQRETKGDLIPEKPTGLPLLNECL